MFEYFVTYTTFADPQDAHRCAFDRIEDAQDFYDHQCSRRATDFVKFERRYSGDSEAVTLAYHRVR